MTKMTEDELMRAYDPTLRTDPTPIEPPQPSVQPRMIHVGARVCLRGHLLPQGGSCHACKKLGKKGPVTIKSRCDRGHIWTKETTKYCIRTRSNGSTYRSRICITCAEAREVKKAAKLERLKADRSMPGFAMRAARIEARKRVDDIDEHILRMVDKLELMSRLEIAQWNEDRIRMLKEKDALVKRFHFA